MMSPPYNNETRSVPPWTACIVHSFCNILPYLEECSVVLILHQFIEHLLSLLVILAILGIHRLEPISLYTNRQERASVIQISSTSSFLLTNSTNTVPISVVNFGTSPLIRPWRDLRNCLCSSSTASMLQNNAAITSAEKRTGSNDCRSRIFFKKSYVGSKTCVFKSKPRIAGNKDNRTRLNDSVEGRL